MPGTVSEVSATLVASTMRRVAAPGRKDALLLLCGQPREQRQDLRALRMMLAQSLGGFADFPLARQEHQHVAAAGARGHLVNRIDDRLRQVDLVLVLVVLVERAVPHVHRVQPSRDLDHRRIVEVLRESSASMVADVMISFSSGRRGSSCLT